MWFAEQFDSFINLGICKEYPNMARSKSISSSKVNRTNTSTNTNKDQTSPGNAVGILDGKAIVGAAPAEIAPEPKIAPKPRKLEVVKAEPRKNVVVPINQTPINMVPINLEDEIRRRAYELYLQRGPASGSEAEDWLTAEREVHQRYHQQSA
jgi:hypothetical protein